MDSTSEAVLAVSGIATACTAIWWVLCVIASWKIFTKAGEAGWKSIIPFYGQYVLTRIAWKPAVFWIIGVSGFLGAFLYRYYAASTAGGEVAAAGYVMLLAALVAYIVSIVYTIRLQSHLSKAFGHGTGFTLGLVFLNPLFMLILGLGKSEYQGAEV